MNYYYIAPPVDRSFETFTNSPILSMHSSFLAGKAILPKVPNPLLSESSAIVVSQRSSTYLTEPIVLATEFCKEGQEVKASFQCLVTATQNGGPAMRAVCTTSGHGWIGFRRLSLFTNNQVMLVHKLSRNLTLMHSALFTWKKDGREVYPGPF